MLISVFSSWAAIQGLMCRHILIKTMDLTHTTSKYVHHLPIRTCTLTLEAPQGMGNITLISVVSRRVSKWSIVALSSPELGPTLVECESFIGEQATGMQ